MTITLRAILLNMAFLLLAGCAGLPTDFERPSLTVSSIAFRNSGSMTPQFDIKLHITNPNRTALNLVGMSYDVLVEGNKVVSGVSNDMPTVEAYGEADVMISAAVNLFGSMRLLNELMNQNPDQIDYEFDAKLDIGGRFSRININEFGKISLR